MRMAANILARQAARVIVSGTAGEGAKPERMVG